MTDVRKGDTFSYGALLPITWPAGTWTADAELVDSRGIRSDMGATLIAPTAPATQYALKLYISATATAALAVGKYTAVVKFTDSSASPEPFVTSAVYAVNIIPDTKGADLTPQLTPSN